MFKVAGKPLMATEMEVIQTLKNDLNSRGLQRLHSIKPTIGNIMVSCPVHKDGVERKPSCGILTVDKKRQDGKILPAGTAHCFTCGFEGELDEFVSRCFGFNDGGVMGRKWLLSHFVSVGIGGRPHIDIKKRESAIISPPTYITEDELASLRYYHPYMYFRKMTNPVIDLFDIGFDPSFRVTPDAQPTPCITFPIRDINGNVLYLARRSVLSKFFHYPEGVEKPVYGRWEIGQVELASGRKIMEVIVCESMINALTCWSYGRVAVALNGTGAAEQYRQLLMMGCRKFILALDPDNAGRSGMAKLRKELYGRKIVTQLVVPEGKDINDLSYDEFISLPEIF